MPQVKIKLSKAIEVQHKDNELVIDGVGTMIFSKGTVEWKPIKNHVNQRTMTWPQFAEALKDAGKPSVVKKKPAAKKPATKKSASA